MAIGELTKLGVVRDSKRGAGIDEFENLIDLATAPRATSKDYFSHCWSRIVDRFPTASGSIRGNLFELTIASLLALESIRPFYRGVELAFVPNVKFDFIIWVSSPTPGYPVCISAKSSLRERYKQADLEAMVLKNVHRKAKTFLLTADIDLNAIRMLKDKISDGRVVALDGCINALDEEINAFIEEMKELRDTYGFGPAPSISVVRAQELFAS